MSKTDRKTLPGMRFLREAPSDDPIYTSGYKIGQKRMSDFSLNTKEPMRLDADPLEGLDFSHLLETQETESSSDDEK